MGNLCFFLMLFFLCIYCFLFLKELQEFPGAVQQYALDEIVDQNAQRGLYRQILKNKEGL